MKQNLSPELQLDHIQLKELRIVWMFSVLVYFDLFCPLSLIFEHIGFILIRKSNVLTSWDVIEEREIKINSSLVDEQAEAISV